MTKTALVTGDLGFVGFQMVKRLVHDGWQVAGWDIKRGQHDDCRNIFKSDKQFGLVVHCAAVVGGRATIDNEPMKVAIDFAIDADFFNYVLRTRPEHAIYYSSSAAYPVLYQDGLVPSRLTENLINLDSADEPDAIYGWVKLTGERLARILVQEHGINLHVLRPFSGYGSTQDLTYPFPALIQRVKNTALGEPFEVWGPGTQTRDWIAVDDIVDLTMASLDVSATDTGPINLCTGVATPFYDLIGRMWYAAGKHLTDLNIVPRLDAPTGVRYRVGDPRKQNKTLGTPKVSLTEGIERAFRGI